MPENNATARPEYSFEGFQAPGYTMVPDELFDEVMPELTGNELKVLMYIVRRTFGFKKNADAISLAQFVKGITKRDGTRLDKGAGVSQKGAIVAVQHLVAMGIIVATAQQDDAGGNAPTLFSLRFRGSVISTDPVGKNYIPWSVEITDHGMKKLQTQETVIQETENKIQRDGSNHFSQFVMAVADDFSRELGDAEHASANMSQANRLWRDSGLDEQEFVARMQEARRRTRQAQGGQGSGAITNKAAYFFQTLRALLTEGRTDE